MQSFYNDAFEKEIDEYLASLDPLDEEAEKEYVAECEALEMIREAAFIDDVCEIKRRLELEEYFLALDAEKGGFEMPKKEIRATALKRLASEFEVELPY
jgi:hypothetical protein